MKEDIVNDDVIKIRLLIQRSGKYFNKEQIDSILGYMNLYCGLYNKKKGKN